MGLEVGVQNTKKHRESGSLSKCLPSPLLGQLLTKSVIKLLLVDDI